MGGSSIYDKLKNKRIFLIIHCSTRFLVWQVLLGIIPRKPSKIKTKTLGGERKWKRTIARSVKSRTRRVRKTISPKSSCKDRKSGGAQAPPLGVFTVLPSPAVHASGGAAPFPWQVIARPTVSRIPTAVPRHSNPQTCTGEKMQRD